MTTVTKSVDEMIDDAIERLPFLRRKIVQRNLARNPEKREEIADQVLLKMSEDPQASAVFGSSIAAGMASGSITAKTPFSLDIDKLEQLIQLILKYLPQILQLFKLFVSIALFIVFSLAMESRVFAASPPNCANGVCRLQQVSSTSPRVAAVPISPRIAAAVPVVSSVVNQARPVAVIANTRQRFSTKPVRAFLGWLRPLNRCRR